MINVEVAIYCDECLERVDEFQGNLWNDDFVIPKLDSLYSETDLVLQGDGRWLCQDCDTSLEQEDN